MLVHTPSDYIFIKTRGYYKASPGINCFLSLVNGENGSCANKDIGMETHEHLYSILGGWGPKFNFHAGEASFQECIAQLGRILWSRDRVHGNNSEFMWFF
jgi:hypothetical protein